jgi:hypothetical protein
MSIQDLGGFRFRRLRCSAFIGAIVSHVAQAVMTATGRLGNKPSGEELWTSPCLRRKGIANLGFTTQCQYLNARRESLEIPMKPTL